MSQFWKNALEVDLPAPTERQRLYELAQSRRWGLALTLAGWLHLLAFSLCYYLTVGAEYNGSLGYLSVWVGELALVWLIFRLCCGRRPAVLPVRPLESFVRRVWIAYFVLAFNLGSLNTLRGHEMFEFFPAIASLASFAFMMLTLTLSWRFFGAVVVMYISGLLMAAHFLHMYLIFAVAWWLVLNWIGLTLEIERRRGGPRANSDQRNGHFIPGRPSMV